MSSLISLEAAIEAVREAYENEETLDGYEYRLNELPCEEPEKGKWLTVSDGYVDVVMCDQCGKMTDGISNFCPNCGADMRGEQDE